MGVTSPTPGHHPNALSANSGNGTVVTRLDKNMGNETRNGTERSSCKCCPYGYHIDVDFVRFCEALSGSEGWGDNGKRISRSRRRQRQSMEGLLGLTGPSVWLMEHHLPKIPQEWPSTSVVSDPACASEMVRDALQQAVIDFEDTLKRSSNKVAPADQTDYSGANLNHSQKDPFPDFNSDQSQIVPHQVSQPPVLISGQNDTKQDSLMSTTSNIANHLSVGSLQVSTDMAPSHEICQDSCTKVLTTCISEMNRQVQNSTYHNLSGPQADSDGISVGSNASAGLSTEALQNIREQMAISLEKMKEMEEKLKLIPILQVQLSILKEEKRKMLLQLKHRPTVTPHEVKSLTSDATQTTQMGVSHERRDASVCCSVLTRDVGISHQQPRLRDVSTTANIPVELPKKPLVFSEVKTQSIHSEERRNTANALMMTDLSGETWNLNEEFPEVAQDKTPEPEIVLKEMKEAATMMDDPLESSLPNLSTSSFLRALDTPPMKSLMIIEKSDSSTQTEEGKSDSLPKKEVVKRDIQVQANLQRSLFSINREVQTIKAKLTHIQTQTQGKVVRDMGISAKPTVRDITLAAKPTTKDFSASCSLTSEKDMSVSLLALGVKVNQEGIDGVPLTKSTDTLDLVSLSDAAVNVCISEPIISHEESQEISNNTESMRDLMIESIEAERMVSMNGAEALDHEFQPIDPPPESPKRKAPLLRQDTYTECKVNVDSLSSETEFSNDNEGLSSQNLTDASKFILEMRRPLCTSDNEAYGETSFESVVTEEESLHQYFASEKNHYSPINRDLNRQKASPSKEMKAAIKVVNDLLQKHPRSNLKTQLKSATGIIQQEWFTISSTAMANPLDVEDYLDYFEDVSVALIEYVVNLPDNTGNTAMHYAVSHGNFDVVSILLDSKVCDIRRPNQAGYTCVMLVSLAEVRSETDRQVVRRLFQMADVNMRAKQHGQTALMLSVSHGRLDMVQLLLEAGADVNIQDEDGSTALMCAAEHGHADIIRALLAQPDCDASIEDNDGSTALNIAMEAGHRNIGVLLYAHEHFQPTSSSPHGSLKQWRVTKHSASQSSTPTPSES